MFFDCASLCNLVNRTNLVRKFSSYAYCFSLHVSGNYVPIIRRKYRTHATSGISHSIYMTVWYEGPCIPDSHLYRVTNTRRRIGTVFSPDDGHMVAWNI